MALKKCKECGNEVSSSAKTCPKCGKKLKMGFFKKALIGIAVLVVLGAIASQSKGGSGGATSAGSSGVSAKQASEEVAGKIGEEIEIGNFIYSVAEPQFKKSIGNEFTSQTADGIYLLIPIGIKNIGDKEHTLDGSMFKLTDQNGTEYSHSTTGSTALLMSGKKTIFLKQCQPNIVTSGLLVFEVPDKTSKYTLKVSGGFWSGKTASISLN